MTSVSASTEVDYDDAAHKYSLKGERYLSSTQIVDRFKNPFDEIRWSLWMVYRYGATQAYWLLKWKTIRDTSLARGKTIHTAKEEYLYRRGIDGSSGRVLQVHRRDLNATEYSKLPDGVYPELKLWNHTHKIAGRADKIILRTHIGMIYSGNILDLIYHYESTNQWPNYRIADVEDYKTNEHIETESYRDRLTGVREMMKSPLEHLMDCDIVHYSLQLSLYQFMLEYHGFMPGHRRIIHEQHPIEGLGTPEPKIIELPYLRDEVIAMLNHLKLAA